MQISFNSNTIALKAQNPVCTNEEQVSKNKGFFETSKDIWKGTLKTYEGTKTYTGGVFRGLKNAIYAGAALVGLDWFGTSIANIAKGNGKTTTWNMIKTPFALAGKALYRGTKYFIEFCKKDGPTIPQALKTALIDTPIKALKKVYRSPNVSKVAKIGLPIIATVVAGYTIIRSKLDYNECAAKIDHRYEGDVGHYNK